MESIVQPFDPGPLCDRDLHLVLEDFSDHPIHRVPCYHFTMRHAESYANLGWLRLRIGSTPHVERYAGHIGYAVEPENRGHRYAARAVQLVLPLARQHGLNPLWITCDPDNLASRRTLQLCGAKFVEIVEVPAECIICQTGHPLKCRYCV